MGTSPTTRDVVSLISAWGGPVDPAVLDSLHDLGLDAVMRAFTGAVADLLGSAAERTDGDEQLANSILVERAVALARSGQMATAAALAEPVLNRPGLPPAVRAALLRTTVMAYASDARVADVDRILGGIDRSLLPAAHLQRLEFNHRHVHVVCGEREARAAALAADVPREVTAATGTLPLVGQAIASMLAGDGRRAVELAECAADGYRLLARQSGEELASVDMWPAQLRLYTYGRHDARRCLLDWRERTAATGQVWVEPYHQMNSAMIALAFGELDDAAAEYDAALELAEQTGQGWVSAAIGARSAIDVVRGDLGIAAERIHRFRATGRPDTLGLRVLDLVAAEIAAARGEPSADLERSWSAAVADDNRLWMLTGGLDHVRVARRLGVDARPMLEELAALDAPPALAHVPQFARAVLDGDVAQAMAAVDGCKEVQSVLDAARLAGDVALQAADHDVATARALAIRATGELHDLGAVGEERILVGELRERNVRLGVRGKRSRPATGWPSLTPTETRIVALVAEGATGPDIGRMLYISPRTVQTHVSHALGKLGLSTRLELAKAYTAHHR